MPKAFCLMTAMPPTKGHRALIEFAGCLSDEVVIVLCTQPYEPYVYERHFALFNLRTSLNNDAGYVKYNLKWLHEDIQQEPNGPDDNAFWEMWKRNMADFDFEPGDYVVASESYGQRLAEVCGGIFMPFDFSRSLVRSKATTVRTWPDMFFSQVLPEFQHYLRPTITVFGAESTGKTTLSRSLADRINGHWLCEWARPYLENTVNEITADSMFHIWQGQLALQDYGKYHLKDKPYLIQDTDLYSTVGYWEMSGWDIGPVPEGLRKDAEARKSDLYIITKSNIPFEPDPLRYGGTEREISDEQWIAFCKRNDLNYYVLDFISNHDERLFAASRLAWQASKLKTKPLTDYRRTGAEYAA